METIGRGIYIYWDLTDMGTACMYIKRLKVDFKLIIIVKKMYGEKFCNVCIYLCSIILYNSDK